MISCSCCTLEKWNWSCSSHIQYNTTYIYCDILEVKIDDIIEYIKPDDIIEYIKPEDENGQNNSQQFLQTNTHTNMDDLRSQPVLSQYSSNRKTVTNKSLHSPRSFKFLKFLDIYKAGALLLCKNKILIVQSRGKKWGFPKGNILPGETLLMCAKREVKEETSMDVDLTENDRLSHFTNHTILYFKEIETTAININDIIKHGKDCSGIGWIRVSCLKKEVLLNKKSFTASIRSIINYYF